MPAVCLPIRASPFSLMPVTRWRHRYAGETVLPMNGLPLCGGSIQGRGQRGEGMTKAAASHRRILFASLVGTSVEFYDFYIRSEEHTSELQSRPHLVCR